MDLADNGIQEHHAKLFFHLVTYTRILSLSLEKNFIKSETLLEIKRAMGTNRQFCALNAANLKLTADDLLCVGELLNMDQLKCLNIS